MIEDQLITILRDHINGVSTLIFETDWSELFFDSKKHEVVAIVFSQCKSFMPQVYKSASVDDSFVSSMSPNASL